MSINSTEDIESADLLDENLAGDSDSKLQLEDDVESLNHHASPTTGKWTFQFIAGSVMSFVVIVAFVALISQIGKARDVPTATTMFNENIAWKMDRTADPCDDFYQYACGGWLENVTLPDDQATWGTFSEVDEETEYKLKEILEDNWPMIGTMYFNCMDLNTIEQQGTNPVLPLLNAIAQTKSTTVNNTITTLHQNGISVYFSFGADADLKNPTINIGYLDQGGFSLPTRDYYLNNDTKSLSLQKALKDHYSTLMRLAGISDSDKKAAKCYDIEYSLASASRTPTERRDPESIYHIKTLNQIAKIVPAFDWDLYWDSLGLLNNPNFTSVNVVEPDFFKKVQYELSSRPIEDIQSYLTCRLLHSTASLLPSAFEQESFAWRQKLYGVKQKLPRWKTCVARVDSALGELLGKYYVSKYFDEQSKNASVDLIEDIKNAFAFNLPMVNWMDNTTKDAALEKMNAIIDKIGYPIDWTNYASLYIEPDQYLRNVLASNAWDFQREIKKIGYPVDRQEWLMRPQDVNAYYNPTTNEIAFPAGILQSPFFSASAPAAANFGGIGAVIGHELTHGFDDEGRQFDATGKLTQWWTQQSIDNFQQRSQCFQQLYSDYTVDVDGQTLHLDGLLTLGENLADCGGVKLAWSAFQKYATENKINTKAIIDMKQLDLSSDQLFFINYAQVWCYKTRPEALRTSISTNPHSPGEFRVRGPLSQFPKFAETFNCKAGSRMNPKNICPAVW